MANFAMGHYLVLFAEGLASAGVRLLVLTSESFAYRARLEGKGIRVVTMARRKSGLGQAAAMLDPRFYREALRELAAFRPDAVHMLNGEGYPLGLLLAARYGHRLVLTLHDPVPHHGSPVDMISRIASLPTLAAANTIHVHRETLRRFVLGLVPGKRVIVAPHGSFAPLFDPPPIDAAAKEDLVLFWGRIEPYKGVDILAASLSAIEGRFSVVIAGAGGLDENTRSLIVAAGSRVSLLNRFIGDEELRALLIRAKYAVFPYRSATQSGAPLLAAAFGVRPVLSPLATFREIAEAVDGILLPGLTAESIAEAINTSVYRPTGLSGSLGFDGIARGFVDGIYPRMAL
jgi:glycosyltransferase involved in cell wall biosynthesis